MRGFSVVVINYQHSDRMCYFHSKNYCIVVSTFLLTKHLQFY